MRGLACLLAILVGTQAVERLRLADGPHGCAGRLEVWYSGRWGTVCDDGWDLRDAAVACRVLGCGGALAAPGGAFFGEGTGPVWLSELACRGSEGQLGTCPHRGWKAHICSHEEDAGVVCVGQRAANSREDSTSLLDGDPWLPLSGELSPSSEEPPVTQAPQPAASSQNGPRKKNPRPPKQAKSTRAPVLTNGAPRQERLRLVSGPHGCAGRLEVWHGGRWGTVCDDGWDLRDAAVACRELGCGGALAAPGGARFGPGSGPVWMDDVGCGGGEQTLRDCPRSPWGRSNCDHTEDAGLVCTGPAPRLRLSDGPHGCAGRLEVWHGGRWGSVCDDAWDLRDAAVACRELGCGGALAAPGGAFFGEGAGPIVVDDLRCRGNETALRFCPARPWGQHDCHHREDAGAVCDGMPLGAVQPTAPAVDSNTSAPRLLSTSVGQTPGPAGSWTPPASPTAPPEPGPEAGSPQLRLVAGPSRCSGRLEVWHDGRWGTVCDDSWDMRDSAVVCRELGCGGPRQPDPAAGRFGWGAGPIWLDDVGCVGTEASLSECPAAAWGKHNCAHNEDVGVTCTGTPGLDTISDPFSWSWLPGLGRDQDAWLPGELATKASASLTSSVLEKTTKAPGKAPKSTKKWVPKNAKRPTTQPPGIPTAKRSRVPGTPSTLNLTPRTSELPKRLTTEAPHRQTSHTTVKATPRVPWVWTSETVASLSTQGPQEVTSEATITQIPQASLEPSGESPEGSLESSRDPAPSPSAGVSVPPGPFRVRLADGPNRCAGRLEVWHAGQWGTVCDDSWDLRDATVACWELGCGKVRPRVGKTHYGPGTGPIWLDDMGCKGSETSLSDCPSGTWGKHNCDHEEDVVLTCTGYTDDDDYPSWTWDPTSGEDLTKGTTVAAWPGQTLSWATTRNPEVPFSATQRLTDTDDQGRYELSWTRDTPARRGLSHLHKGTPTTSQPRPTVTSGTGKSPGHPFPAPRARADTGSPRKPKPERRLLRPTPARTAPPTSSPASGSRLTSGSWPQLIPDSASKPERPTDPPETSPPTPGMPSLTVSDSTSSSSEASLPPTPIPEHSRSPAPASPKGLTSDSSALSEVTSLPPTSELSPESDTTPDLGTTPKIDPESSDSSDLPMSPRTPTFTAPHPTTTSNPTTAPEPTTVPHPTTAPEPTTVPHPTTAPEPTTVPHPTTIPHPTTTSHPTMTPQHTTNPQLPRTPHPTATPQPPTNPHISSAPATPTNSLPSSLETELPSLPPEPKVKPSLHPELTLVGAPPTVTSPMQNPEPSPASESDPSGPSPAPSVDPLSTEVSKPPRSQSPRLTSPPIQTPHSTSDPTVTPDLHLSSMAHPLDQPPPDHLTQGPSPNPNPGPLGPCVSPEPPVRVMACEPPALVELVAAVREVGDQLQRLTQVLEQDRRDRRVLGLGLVQLVEAAQGLGQLSETVKRLAEVAWPPSTPVPTTPTTTEEERPLRGDV
ncbi:soluble scavenger receptor cysteine-rich domain-containing protein SSC5D [Peromyscus eremicus]|uniref:soluble scavenger receptor cysteine-rich domain-containing protein SSC5D n=1 Tax=Peromyscus eremicus TaxID=42410 RepID=UPI0027DC921C|nr:soluble scavenger receptor cysteine-rich domain-containing protein SSC5D [Peromyscus eremicus]